MLGRDHALSGAVGFMALAPVLHTHLHELPTISVPLGVGGVVSAAFALLPDIDEPGSTVSRKLGPLSRAVSRFTNKLAGGHRQATHSLLFCVAVFFLVRLADTHPLARAVVIGCAFLLVFRMLVPVAFRFTGLVTPVMLVLAGFASWWALHVTVAWLPLAAAGGVAVHLLGDSITVEGVPWLWLPLLRPLQRLRIAIPIVGHTGSLRESVVGSVLAIGILWCVAANIMVPLLHSHFPSVQLPNVPRI